MSERILALDAATEVCSAALWNDGEVTYLSDSSPRIHAQKMLPMVKQLLDESSLSLSQLDALAFGRGPGSFTGIRIGISIAQGLAFGADRPLIAISNLNTLAEGAWRQHQQAKVLTAIDARMGEIYWAVYQRQEEGHWQVLDKEQLLAPVAIIEKLSQYNEQWALAGSGWQTYPELLVKVDHNRINNLVYFPLAQDMLSIARYKWQLRDIIAPENAQAIYLRNEVAWQKTS